MNGLSGKPGYCLEVLFESSNVFVFVKNGEKHNACKLFDMILQLALWFKLILKVTREIEFGNAPEVFVEMFVKTEFVLLLLVI